MTFKKNAPYLKICGGRRLKGELRASGAKNSVLPILFASLLSKGEENFKNVPDLKDVRLALKMLSSLGLTFSRSKNELSIKNQGVSSSKPCPESAKSFRASVLCLGPLLACLGKVKVPLPGGCEIGSRPIDLHLKGLKKLGAKIFIKNNWIYGEAPKEGLKAAKIELDFPSVGATENLILASCLAKGTSYLKNIAIEPEITDLINYLNSLGAHIEPAGFRALKITGQIQTGQTQLKSSGKVYKIIPDRIEAGTWLIATACTKGEILIKDCQAQHLTALLELLKKVGCVIEVKKSDIFLKASTLKQSLDVKTGVYPCFPTDLQSQFMALMTQLKGDSSLQETIFENRFAYIKQLNLLGAGIKVKGLKAFVKGPVLLKGHKIKASDLRAGAGLALAGLVAKGESRLYGLHHIERGYESFFSKLKSLGANVAIEFS